MQAAACASAAMLSPSWGVGQEGAAAGAWWLARYPKASRVIEAHSARLAHAGAIAAGHLGEMISRCARALTDKRSSRAAWRAILGDAERIVLKFNSVGAQVLGTTDTLARQLVYQLGEAGYAPGRVTLIEAPALLRHELGTAAPPSGWGGHIRVGDRVDELAAWLLEADAIINVGFLKTHQIAGMSCCMKNLSHAAIRRPARFHANGCSPAVAQIVGDPQVSGRLRLNLVNALRLVVRNGPDANAEDVAAYGGLLMGFDPVAVDACARALLDIERNRFGLPPVNVRYLRAAARLRVGRVHPAELERVAVRDVE